MNAFLSYTFPHFSQLFPTKRDGQTDGQTDRHTDGGRCNISRPGHSAPREITRHGLGQYYRHLYTVCPFEYVSHVPVHHCSPNYLLLCGHVGY